MTSFDPNLLEDSIRFPIPTRGLSDFFNSNHEAFQDYVDDQMMTRVVKPDTRFPFSYRESDRILRQNVQTENLFVRFWDSQPHKIA
jgi:hypothetical protein